MRALIPNGTKICLHDNLGTAALKNWHTVTGAVECAFDRDNGRHYVIRLDICAVHPTRGVLVHCITAHEDNVRQLD